MSCIAIESIPRRSVRTNSEIKAFRRCPRYWKYAYVDRYRSASPAVALVVGSGTHAGLDSIWRGLDPMLGLTKYMALNDPAWWHNHPDGKIWAIRSRVMLRAYVAHWRNDRERYQTISVEERIRGRIKGKNVQGQLDALVRDRVTKQLYVVEHKTTADEIDNCTGVYWQRLPLDSQIAVYADCVSQMLGETVGVIYDVLRKPRSLPKSGAEKVKRKRARQRKTETEEQFKLRAAETDETEEAYEIRKSAAAETLDEYEERITNLIAAEPEQWFGRREILRTDDEIECNRTMLAHTMNAMDDEEFVHQVFVRHDERCRDFNRACTFLDVCNNIATLDDPRFIQLKTKTPELGDSHV